ncbi:MAG: hypothetical protein JO071_11290 [Deltaproteobacteria bacterium]|nr:hypothetical protein [Deltaproteobacteria bacterium]
MDRRGATLQSACAFSIYLAISLLFFSPPLLGHFAHRYIGGRADPLIQMWALAWWPHALASGVHPIITQAVWAPAGYNLAWTTSIPGPSLLLYPITRLFGPLVSYNLLCLLYPPLAAFSAFALCRYLTGQFWPAIVGGYVFGFSQYMLAHVFGHLFLLFIFPIPLAIYVVLLRLSRRITRIVFVALLVTLLLCEFFSSIELFATTAVFGAAALALSWLIWRAASAADIRDVAIEIGCAYLVTVVLAAPYLYYVLGLGVPAPINPSAIYSNDLLAFAVPTPVLYAGRAFSEVVSHFRSGGVETAGYLGPGCWIILVLYIESRWPTKPGKFLIISLMFIGLMSLGPVVHIDGIDRVPGPWLVLSKLPLIDQALPSRFGMYFFLVAAVITSLYLTQSSISWWSKLLLSSICLLSLAPNLALFRSGVTHLRIPPFFRSGEYKRYLARNDNVLVLPFVEQEDGLLWQVQTDFYFRLAAARLTLPPAEASGWPVLSTLYTGDEILDFTEQFQAFLSAHGVKAVIVDPQAGGPWQRLLSEAGLVPLKTGGLLFYQVPPPLVAQFRGATAREMAEKEARVSFAALLNAARRYLAAGFPLPMLSLWQAQRLKLLTLPAETPASFPADPHWWRNLWLGPRDESMVGIGITGDYGSLQPLVDDYGADATDIYFPYPKKLAKGLKSGNGQLLLTFTPEGLRRAANKTIGTDTGPG